MSRKNLLDITLDEAIEVLRLTDSGSIDDMTYSLKVVSKDDLKYVELSHLVGKPSGGEIIDDITFFDGDVLCHSLENKNFRVYYRIMKFLQSKGFRF